MNDAFVGDIGDYGKYGLLRVLNRAGGFRLGIVWMKTMTKADTSDRPVASRPVFRYIDTSVKSAKLLDYCDPELYRKLQSLVNSGKRTIQGLQDSGILPDGTIYFDKQLDFRDMSANGKKALEGRLRRRSRWFSELLGSLRATELVFFDPDNGLENNSTGRHTAEGPKYLWYDELKPFYDQDRSLVVYQSADRGEGGAESTIRRRACDLKDILGCEQIWALRWHRVLTRFYFLIPATEHITRMEQAIDWLQASPWCQGGHFSVTQL